MNPLAIVAGYGVLLGLSLLGVFATTGQLVWYNPPQSGKRRWFQRARLPLSIMCALIAVSLFLITHADNNMKLAIGAFGVLLVGQCLWYVCSDQFLGQDVFPREADTPARIAVRSVLLLGSPVAILVSFYAFFI